MRLLFTTTIIPAALACVAPAQMDVRSYTADNLFSISSGVVRAEQYYGDGAQLRNLTRHVVTQASHGFTTLVPVYKSEGTWYPASSASLETVAKFVVVQVYDDNTFAIASFGFADVPGHGLADGWWFSGGDVGSVTNVAGKINNPVFYVVDSDTVEVNVLRVIYRGGP